MDLRLKTDEAAQWRNPEHNGRRYFYHVATKERRWDMPAVVDEVKTLEFKERLCD